MADINWFGFITNGGELYDLQVDPAESSNLYSSPEYADVKLRIQEMLADLAWTVDLLPVRLAEW